MDELMNENIAGGEAVQPVSLEKNTLPEQSAPDQPSVYTEAAQQTIYQKAASQQVQQPAPDMQQRQFEYRPLPQQPGAQGRPNPFVGRLPSYHPAAQYPPYNAPVPGGYAVPNYPQYAQAPVYAGGTPYGAGASVMGSANAYPVFSFQKTPQETERDNIKEAAGKGGALSIAVTIAMVVVGIIVGITAFLTGTFTMESDGSDPYMGFTPIGYYTFEGLASMISIFIPSLIILFSMKKKDKLRYEDILPFEKIKGKKLATVVFAGMGVCMIAQIMSAMLSYNFSLFGFDVESAVNTTLGTTGFDLLMNTICTAFIPAIVEEFAFRGVVLGALKKYDVNLAIVGSAFLFGMVHGNLAQIPFAFVVGLVLAYVRVKCDSMLPNILIHFGNNFYAVILMTVSETADGTVTSIVDAAFIITLVIIGLISFYSLAKNDKDFFKTETTRSYLTFGEKLKAFFTSGPVIASTILLCLETLTMVKLL